jgi:hypothetical protein
VNKTVILLFPYRQGNTLPGCENVNYIPLSQCSHTVTVFMDRCLVTVVKINKLLCTLALTSTNPSMARGYERSYFKLSLASAANLVPENTTKYNTI